MSNLLEDESKTNKILPIDKLIEKSKEKYLKTIIKDGKIINTLNTYPKQEYEKEKKKAHSITIKVNGEEKINSVNNEKKKLKRKGLKNILLLGKRTFKFFTNKKYNNRVKAIIENRRNRKNEKENEIERDINKNDKITQILNDYTDKNKVNFIKNIIQNKQENDRQREEEQEKEFDINKNEEEKEQEENKNDRQREEEQEKEFDINKNEEEGQEEEEQEQKQEKEEKEQEEKENKEIEENEEEKRENEDENDNNNQESVVNIPQSVTISLDSGQTITWTFNAKISGKENSIIKSDKGKAKSIEEAMSIIQSMNENTISDAVNLTDVIGFTNMKISIDNEVIYQVETNVEEELEKIKKNEEKEEKQEEEKSKFSENKGEVFDDGDYMNQYGEYITCIPGSNDKEIKEIKEYNEKKKEIENDNSNINNSNSSNSEEGQNDVNDNDDIGISI